MCNCYYMILLVWKYVIFPYINPQCYLVSNYWHLKNNILCRFLTRSQPKCVLVDWSSSDENFSEGRIISSEPENFVNDIPLAPLAVKVLVETAIKSDCISLESYNRYVHC